MFLVQTTIHAMEKSNQKRNETERNKKSQITNTNKKTDQIKMEKKNGEE